MTNGHVSGKTDNVSHDDGHVRHFFERLCVVQRRTPGAVRCTAPSSTSGVQTPGPVACRVDNLRLGRRVWHGRVVLAV